jgi:hypothetical protein
MTKISQTMLVSQKLSKKICCQGAKSGGLVPANITKLLIIFYCLLKMSQGQTAPDTHLEPSKAESPGSVNTTKSNFPRDPHRFRAECTYQIPRNQAKFNHYLKQKIMCSY